MVTLYNLLERNHLLFDTILLPEGVDKDMVADTIISQYGPEDVIYDNPKIFEYYNQVWFKRKNYTIQKLFDTLNFDYNPIENYNRKEDYAEINDDEENTTRNLGRNSDRTQDTNDTLTEKTNESGTDNTNTSNLSEVSPFNANTFVNDSQSSGNESFDHSQTVDHTHDVNNNMSAHQEDNENETRLVENDRKKNSNLWARGNIGVTTTQQMIQEEREVVQFDLYEWIAREWAKEFIVQCWN